MKLTSGNSRFRDPVSTIDFEIFAECLKNMLADLSRFHALVLTHIELFWMCDVRLRMRENVGSGLFECTAGWKEVLRAPAAHDVSS